MDNLEARSLIDTEPTEAIPLQVERGPTSQKKIYDVEGKLLVAIEMVFSDEDDVEAPYQTLDGKNGTMRKTGKIMLRKDDTSEPVDLLEFIKQNSDLRDGFPDLFVAQQRLSNYESTTGKVVVPPIESSIDIAVLLHELGHSDQLTEGRFKALGSWSDPETITSPEQAMEAFDQLKDSVASLPIDKVKGEAALLMKDADKLKEDIRDTSEKIKILKKQESLLRGGIFLDATEVALWLQKLDASKSDQESKDIVGEITKRLQERGFVFEDNALSLVEAPKKSLAGRLGRSVKSSEAEIQTKEASKKLSKDEFTPSLARQMLRFMGDLTEEECNVLPDGSFKLLKSVILDDGQKRFLSARAKLSPDQQFALVGQILKLEDKRYGEQFKFSQLEKEAEEKEISILKLLEPYTSLPQRLMERDATRRAIKWMVKLRERFGIDLSGKIDLPPNYYSEDIVDACSESVLKSGNDDVLEKLQITPFKFLGGALKTYKATKIGLPGEGDSIVVPKVGKR